MTYKKRLFLIFSSAMGFIVITPIALFYALGYRYYPETGQILKIGMIIAQYEPVNAQAYLDGELVSKRSPAKIRSLVPKTYTLEIKKDGYQTWKRSIQVTSGFITWTPRLLLFPNQFTKSSLLPEIDAVDAGGSTGASTSEALYFGPSGDGREIGYAVKKPTGIELDVYDTDKKTTRKIFPREEQAASNMMTVNSVKNMIWSADSRKAIIELDVTQGDKTGATYLLYDDRKDSVTFLKDLFGFQIADPSWSSTDSSFLYWITEQKLHRFDTDKNTLSNALETDIRGFTTVGDSLYYVTKTTPTAEQAPVVEGQEYGAIWRMNLDGSQKTQLSEPFLLDGNTFKIVVSKQSHVALINRKDGTLFVLSPENGKLIAGRVADGVREAVWDAANPDEDVLVYSTQHELSAYRYELAQHETITRISDDVKDFVLFPQYEYVVYQTPTELRVVEIAFEGERNHAVVAPVSDQASQLLFVNSGSAIGFADRDELNGYRFFTVKMR